MFDGRFDRLRSAGFTMVELLITLTVISVLAAVTLPVLTQQISKARAARMVTDLSSIETALAAFHLDVRSGYPGQLEQLINRPTGSEESFVDGRAYSSQDVENWNGPYLDKPMDDILSDFDVALTTGSEHGIVNGLACYDPLADFDAGNMCAGGSHFVAVRIAGLDRAEFETVSALLDGAPTEAGGELRYDPELRITYFLAVPYID